MSSKLIPYGKHYGILKKREHSRKSILWHKKRILARLNPRVDKGQKIIIEQHIHSQYIIAANHITESNEKQSMLSIRIETPMTRGIEEYTTNIHYLRRHPVQEHHRIVQALRYLVAEGKIESSMSTKEWDIQLALGTAEMRTFTRKRE